MFSFIFIYYLLVSGTNYEILPSLLVVVIIFIDIAMYVADEYESSIITEKQKATVYLKDLENQRENVEAIEQRNLETEKRNHDLKKNVRLIKDLIENNRYDEAREYVCKLEEKCSTYFSYRLYSNHSVINSLLNSKIEFCQSNGVDDVELYCLLVNLLDNAIAAAMLSEKPYISIFLNCSDTEIYGEFINTIKTTECSGFEDLIPENNKDGHGYGLLNLVGVIQIGKVNLKHAVFSIVDIFIIKSGHLPGKYKIIRFFFSGCFTDAPAGICHFFKHISGI